MIYLSEQAWLPARLALNPVVVPVEAADPVTYADRSGLRYYCRIMVPASYLSATYTELVTLEGAEIPPSQSGAETLYLGAFFDIQEQLNALLDRKAPNFGQTQITVASDLVTPYYCQLTVTNNDLPVSSLTQPVQYAIKAGINERDYAAYKDLFFSEFQGKKRRFLTWAPETKLVHPDSPEFLYFFTNLLPVPASLTVSYRVVYSDQTTETGKGASVNSVYPYAVYIAPVGPKALGLEAKAKTAVSYKVWLSNEKDDRVSEIREYRLDPEYRRNVRFILFANSLGGFDTLYLTGSGEESLKVTRQTSERFTGWEYLPSYSEKVINQVTGERELTVATPWLTRDGLKYLEELILTKEAYLVTDRAFVPLIPTLESFRSAVDSEDLAGRSLTFRYANPETAYSLLPNPSGLPARPTGWRAKATACLVDARGIRTGKMAATLLEQYYLDDFSRVPGAPVKPNTPGTTGYIAPVDSETCAVTPYLSAAISRAGSFIRQTCGNGYIGGPATIQVAVGAYGSEISLADANAKAEAEFTRLNTQAFADANGTCTLQPELYTWNVPSGYFHYRGSDAARIAIYYATGGVYAGNAWTVQQYGGPNVYPQGTNDLNLPPLNIYNWKFYTYGTPNTPITIKIYVNGTLRSTIQSTLNKDGYEHHPFTDLAAVGGFQSGDKVYIQLS